MANDSKTGRLDFAEHATRKTTLIEKKAHSGGLGNAALVSVPNGVTKKGRNEYEQP
jgi:hypothetical protein